MQEINIYKDIAERTNGDIYVGVVGPVRSGKSTFITRFLEQLVVSAVKSKHSKERMRDELPQSAQGKTIMTTQPKFVPNEAIALKLNEIDVKIRLVDCVGYLIDGAQGHTDEGKPRLVKTPWSEKEMPFEDAADLGTKKVITEHSTVGIVMTTDGSIGTELPRAAYVPAEERVISELKELGKPFVIVLNSSVPASGETQKLALSLQERHGTAVVAIDVAKMGENEINIVFEKLLYEFELNSVDVNIPRWLRALPLENDIIASLANNILAITKNMNKMSDYAKAQKEFAPNPYFSECITESVKMGEGRIVLSVNAYPDLFYKALSAECGVEILDEFNLMASIKGLTTAKRQYDKLKDALEQVKNTGYGVVYPSLDEMKLEDPQISKTGSKFGVKLKASAPSLHIMQVDIESEVNPIVGTEQQSEELVKYLLSEFETNPKGIWETNMFGKSLHALVNEGLNNKLTAMPDDTQKKMRKTLSRIINEGKGGVICIIL